jgi:hypothetical protein
MMSRPQKATTAGCMATVVRISLVFVSCMLQVSIRVRGKEQQPFKEYMMEVLVAGDNGRAVTRIQAGPRQWGWGYCPTGTSPACPAKETRKGSPFRRLVAFRFAVLLAAVRNGVIAAKHAFYRLHRAGKRSIGILLSSSLAPQLSRAAGKKLKFM